MTLDNKLSLKHFNQLVSKLKSKLGSSIEISPVLLNRLRITSPQRFSLGTLVVHELSRAVAKEAGLRIFIVCFISACEILFITLIYLLVVPLCRSSGL